MSQPTLNRVFLIGYLTQKPVLRYVPSGTPVTSFPLGVYRGYTSEDGKEILDYFTIIAWKDLAVFCEEKLRRNDWVFVEGRIQVRVYEDTSGRKRKAYEIVALDVKRLSGLRGSESSSDDNLFKLD